MVADQWHRIAPAAAIGPTQALHVTGNFVSDSSDADDTANLKPDPGRPLRVVRAEHLLSIRELARIAAVAPSTIYMIEAGRSVPRFAAIRRICTALGVQAHEIAEFRRVVERYSRPN
ncbi:MAG: helix-turn-helix transcriptional regulator [Chloroflexi bacterium]|nr:helix-turn-helix transcriptional regulator [Chloroflexota bacterium]